MLPSGPAARNPWELFSSRRLAELGKFLLERADYVLYDAPPATTFTDTLNLATVADAALLSVRALEPLTGEEARLVERFEQAGTHVMGSVLSHVPLSLLESYRTAQPTRSSRALPAFAPDALFDNVDVLTKTEEQDAPDETADALPTPQFEPFSPDAPVAEPIVEPIIEPTVEPIAQAAPLLKVERENQFPETTLDEAPFVEYQAPDQPKSHEDNAPYLPVVVEALTPGSGNGIRSRAAEREC